MKKLLFLLFLFLFILSRSFAGDLSERIQEAKKRVLLVIIEEPKVDTAGDVRTEYNIKVKSAFLNHWTFNDSIIFKPRSEVKKICESVTEKYLIADFRFTSDNNGHLYGPFEEPSGKNYFESGRHVFFYLSEAGYPSTFIRASRSSIVTVPCNYNDEEDITKRIKDAQSTLGWSAKNNRRITVFDVVDMNHSLLYSLTLLVDTALLFNKSDTAKISEYYPYSYKLSNQKEIYTARSDHDERYAYIEVVTVLLGVDKKTFRYLYIYDTKLNRVLSISPRGAFTDGGGVFQYEGKIRPRNFKNFAVQ